MNEWMKMKDNGLRDVRTITMQVLPNLWPQLAFTPGMTHTSVLTLEYMAPLRTSPLRIQMIEAAGLALSAWQVRLRGSPACRLTTGPPLMTGFSGGTKEREGISYIITGRWGMQVVQNQMWIVVLIKSVLSMKTLKMHDALFVLYSIWRN